MDQLENTKEQVLLQITRELNKEFSMYYYPIYTNTTWSMLMIDMYLDIIPSGFFHHILSLWYNVM